MCGYLYELFGYPDVFVNKPGGFAIWFKSKKNPFNEIILKDEMILNSNNQYDFLYITVSTNIIDQQLPLIYSIKENVFYDNGTKELTVRSNSLKNNLIMLQLIESGLQNGHISNFYDKLEKVNTYYPPLEKFTNKMYRPIPVAP
jgi:hypothetical protein